MYIIFLSDVLPGDELANRRRGMPRVGAVRDIVAAGEIPPLAALGRDDVALSERVAGTMPALRP